MKEKASFVVVNEDGSEYGDYSGVEPKAAATKAVNRICVGVNAKRLRVTTLALVTGRNAPLPR